MVTQLTAQAFWIGLDWGEIVQFRAFRVSLCAFFFLFFYSGFTVLVSFKQSDKDINFNSYDHHVWVV